MKLRFQMLALAESLRTAFSTYDENTAPPPSSSSHPTSTLNAAAVEGVGLSNEQKKRQNSNFPAVFKFPKDKLSWSLGKLLSDDEYVVIENRHQVEIAKLLFDKLWSYDILYPTSSEYGKAVDSLLHEYAHLRSQGDLAKKLKDKLTSKFREYRRGLKPEFSGYALVTQKRNTYRNTKKAKIMSNEDRDQHLNESNTIESVISPSSSGKTQTKSPPVVSNDNENTQTESTSIEDTVVNHNIAKPQILADGRNKINMSI
jgi:hypothetical protein